jgi:membrane protein implicated in regulation of membrane protease activity
MKPTTLTRRQAETISTSRTKHTATARLRWRATALAAGITAFLAGAPAALAVNVEPPDGSPATVPPAHLWLATGTPGWQIALIAAGSALLASALTRFASRVTQRHPFTSRPTT